MFKVLLLAIVASVSALPSGDVKNESDLAAANKCYYSGHCWYCTSPDGVEGCCKDPKTGVVTCDQ
ncbi:hypothetical protein HDV01_007874 [Terramyces sp. JEL0728]|nr:hypothetical protein HDV01_007874 [Terramyces sp. JEL0728]